MEHITIIPSDNIVIVDNIAINFKFNAPNNLHAIQWYGNEYEGYGEIEYTDDFNKKITTEDFEKEVLPYLNLYNDMKKQIEEEIEKQKQQEIEKKKEEERIYNSEESRFNRLRQLRNSLLITYDEMSQQINRQIRLAKTEIEKEKYIKELEKWDNYAEELCHLPEQEGAPWDGGEKETPWPNEPDIKK